MQQGLLHLHNFLRWFVIIFAIWTIIKTMGGLGGNKPFTKAEKRPAMLLMIVCDIQLLLGLVLYFTGAWGLKNIQNQGMGPVMKDSMQRFWAVEHLAGMLIAIVLIHIGYASVKKAIPDGAKYKESLLADIGGIHHHLRYYTLAVPRCYCTSVVSWHVIYDASKAASPHICSICDSNIFVLPALGFPHISGFWFYR